MVQIEEVSDDVVPPKKTLQPSEAEKNKKKPAMKGGFLNDPKRESLYGPEGSEQGTVSAEQKKKWQEHDMNENMNKKMGNKYGFLRYFFESMSFFKRFIKLPFRLKQSGSQERPIRGRREAAVVHQPVASSLSIQLTRLRARSNGRD